MVAQTQAPRRRLRAALLAGLAALALALPCEARHRANAPAPAPQSVVASYQTRIHPILVTKCAACHTGTPERPLYYFIPILNLWSQPFIEDHIRQGRVQFDFSNGFPAGRVGAAHEFIARLRNSVQDRSMPPVEYALVHWAHRLTEDERKAILSGAEAGIAALNTVRSSREMASVDAPEIPAQIAAAIAQACPLADRKDARARDACAERLARSEILKARMQEPFLWGGQEVAGDYDLEHSPSNRFNPLAWRVTVLEATARDLALGVTRYKCFECHTPAIYAKMNILEFFNNPNQALTGRNRIIALLEDNAMPPIDGSEDPRDRQTLLELARDFKRIADEALKFENEKLEDSLTGPVRNPAR